MLKSLSIKNYAIIDELNIDFSKGFNVFTGETGAGKSIIVGALSLLSKGKADSSIIKANKDKAIIEGVFDLNPYFKDKLDEADIDYDDELIVRRIISKDKSVIKVNNVTCTLNFLSSLFEENIDIHSQRDNQYLLNKKNHLILLDKYAHIDLKDYLASYNAYLKAFNEYEDMINNTYSLRDIEYLKYDYEELSNADLDINEEEELNRLEKRYKDSEKYLSVLNETINLFDEEDGIDEKLSSLIKKLNINDEEFNEIKNNIESYYYSLIDEIDKLKKILNSYDDEDLNIDYIEERLYKYSKLKRKYNLNTEGLISRLKEIEEKLKFYNDSDRILDEKKKEVESLKKIVLSKANSISDLRNKKALELEKDVLKQCEDLMLKNTRFKINIVESKLGYNGIDEVEFYISFNLTSELRPLRNVASGGELSRLMLALKTIFTKLSDVSLIIFDEIDTGVSGKVALAIGQKMAKIAKNTQVLTITHLAMVAACADNHYLIYKDDNSSNIKELNKEEIIKELANISSADDSENALLAARQLYKTAQESIL